MERDINDELRNISAWLKVNKLSLNVDKTYYMILSRKKTERKNITVRINEKVISEVRKIKFLGVMLDNKVNWKDHINYISGKVSHGIGMILKARRSLTKKAWMTLYYSFIYPYLTYCYHIWGSTYQNNLMKLQKFCSVDCMIWWVTTTLTHWGQVYIDYGKGLLLVRFQAVTWNWYCHINKIRTQWVENHSIHHMYIYSWNWFLIVLNTAIRYFELNWNWIELNTTTPNPRDPVPPPPPPPPPPPIVAYWRTLQG